MTDRKLATWAGVRGLFLVLLVELSTVGIARNATFAVKSTVPWRAYINDGHGNFAANTTYDPTEFTPLVLHLINEFGPPATVKRSSSVPFTSEGATYPHLC